MTVSLNMSNISLIHVVQNYLRLQTLVPYVLSVLLIIQQRCPQVTCFVILVHIIMLMKRKGVQSLGLKSMEALKI